MLGHIITALEEGATVLTRNARLKHSIETGYALHQRAQGHSCWPRASIRSWKEWLLELADRAAWANYRPAQGARILLNGDQEQLLWERAIRASSLGDGLLSVPAAAADAREAWRLVQGWRLPDPGARRIASDDERAFSRWMRNYHARCRDGGYLDLARLPDALAAAIKAGVLELPASLLLVGFIDANPQEQSLLEAVQARGCSVGRISATPAGEVDARRVEFASSEQELMAAARWTRDLLAQGRGERIAICVPRLGQQRELVARVFDDVLLPGSVLPGSSRFGKPYNIAQGLPLGEHPVVRAAQLVLELTSGHMPSEAFSRLLRTPYLYGGSSELAPRALFDLWLREQGFVDVEVAAIPSLLGTYRSAVGLDLDQLLLKVCFQSILPHLAAAENLHSPAGWAEHFRLFLQAMGWPGERPLDRAEHQAVAEFREALGRFASLEIIAAQMTLAEALVQFRRLLRRSTFEPRGAGERVQIIGDPAAVGGSFGHLWVCGLDLSSWPPPARPNPFIPYEWQLAKSLPRATASAELETARILLQTLLGSASEVIVSSLEGESSPLIRDFPLAAQGDIAQAELTDYRRLLQESSDIEILEQTRGPALAGLEALQGGTELLRLQAACPFRAFAELRLGAKPLQTPGLGLDAAARGFLVHAALEYLWHRIGSSEVLHAVLGGEHLEVQVWEVADRALAVLRRKRLATLGQRFGELEHARLVQLLIQWLELEQQRSEFEVIGTEVERVLQIGGLEIKIRIDRIDRLGQHGHALIDYKTALHSIAAWQGERPDEPQLPVYALSEGAGIAALVFGCITPGRMEFTGMAREDGLLPGVTVLARAEQSADRAGGWEKPLSEWRSALDALATGFREGVAAVAPKHSTRTCRGCSLGSLCRVRELGRLQEQLDVG